MTNVAGHFCSHIGTVSQAVLAAMSKVHRRHMRTRLYRHFQETAPGAQMYPAIVSGIVTGDTRAGQLLANVFIVPSNSPRSLCEN